MSDVLFVYGTLMGREPGAEPARIRGELWDLGPFPAAWNVGGAGAGVIHGELMPVDAARLRELDRYEGVRHGLYRRIRTALLGETGEANGREAWVYEFGRCPEERGARKVEDGKWKRRY